MLNLYRAGHEVIGGLTMRPPEGLNHFFWRPTWTHVHPYGAPLRNPAMYWTLQQARIFHGHDYGMYVVYDGGTLVSSLVAAPRYFRFPFMAEGDIFFNDGWTHPDYRGRGLNTLTFVGSMRTLANGKRNFWGITDPANAPMVRVLDKCGFETIGRVERRSRLGLRLLGYYQQTR